MHVLMTANSAWNILNFRRPVVEALLNQGHRVTVAAPLDDAVPEIESMGIRVLPVEMSAKGLNPLELLTLRRQYLSMFRTERPDVVLSYTIKNNLCGALAARSTGVPFVPNVTGLGTAFLSGGLLQSLAETLYRRAFSHLPIVFFQNTDDSALFLRRGLLRPDQVRQLPGSGIDLERFAALDLPDNDTGIVFLMVARLLRDKGVVEYAEAARLVRAQRPETRFRILGAIGSENRTAVDRETVEGWVDDGTIEYLGTSTDVRHHIAAAHCVVLPSYREGAPRTLIEAAAMGRPLVATDVPGCRSVVSDGENGYLCQARETESLAEACMKIVNLQVEARRQMGASGRRKMQNEFGQELVIKAYQRAIEEVVSRPA